MAFSSDCISASIFWDVDFSALDWEKHKVLIIQRVIERGSYNAIKEITEYYGRDKVVAVIKELPFLQQKDIAFVHIYFNIALNDLKCYTRKQSTSNYLN